MKIKNYLTIFLAVCAIIGLLFVAAYATYLNADDANPFKQTVTTVVEDLDQKYELGLVKLLYPSQYGGVTHVIRSYIIRENTETTREDAAPETQAPAPEA